MMTAQLWWLDLKPSEQQAVTRLREEQGLTLAEIARLVQLEVLVFKSSDDGLVLVDPMEDTPVLSKEFFEGVFGVIIIFIIFGALYFAYIAPPEPDNRSKPTSIEIYRDLA